MKRKKKGQSFRRTWPWQIWYFFLPSCNKTNNNKDYHKKWLSRKGQGHWRTKCEEVVCYYPFTKGAHGPQISYPKITLKELNIIHHLLNQHHLIIENSVIQILMETTYHIIPNQCMTFFVANDHYQGTEQLKINQTTHAVLLELLKWVRSTRLAHWPFIFVWTRPLKRQEKTTLTFWASPSDLYFTWGWILKSTHLRFKWANFLVSI